MTALVIRPCRRDDARAFVKLHHSHNKESAAADCFRLSAWLGDTVVAVAIMGEATAPGLGSPCIWEVTRLCVGPNAPHFTASRLLGACGRVMDGAGVQLGVSYTRIDERGTSYRASNWTPVALSKGRRHDTGNRRGRVTHRDTAPEIVDRVRWERGPSAASAQCAWSDLHGRWVRVPSTRVIACGPFDCAASEVA